MAHRAADGPLPLEQPLARRQIPAWLMSFCLHFSIFTSAAYFLHETPRGIAGVEAGREAGIVLVSSTRSKTNYLSEEDAGGGMLSESASSAESSASAHAASPFPAEAELPATTGSRLPTKQGPLGTSGMPSESALASGNFTDIGKGLPRGKGKGKGSTTQTAVFGVQGEGSKFVYVFDRSSSMEGAPLNAAKRQLIKSLESLDKIHEFQIIFYNHQPRLMQLRPDQPTGMVFGNDEGKMLAERFVGGILADGGTRHMEALELALQLNPDVIFFLTDADDPQLSADELRRVRRLNQGTSINAIEFGIGPARGGYNFLKRLANENHGNYGYVDTSRL